MYIYRVIQKTCAFSQFTAAPPAPEPCDPNADSQLRILPAHFQTPIADEA